jgi:hypothetical protein
MAILRDFDFVFFKGISMQSQKIPRIFSPRIFSLELFSEIE